MRSLLALAFLAAAGCGPGAPPVTYETEAGQFVSALHSVSGAVTNETNSPRDISVEYRCGDHRASVRTLPSVPSNGTVQFSESVACETTPSVVTAYGSE